MISFIRNSYHLSCHSGYLKREEQGFVDIESSFIGSETWVLILCFYLKVIFLIYKDLGDLIDVLIDLSICVFLGCTS